MSTGTPDPEVIAEGGAEPGQEEALEASLTSPARLTAYLRRGGVIVPILTTLIAFLAAGVVVLLTGHNPLSTSNAIFTGTGPNWLFRACGDVPQPIRLDGGEGCTDYH